MIITNKENNTTCSIVVKYDLGSDNMINGFV